jgi:hypothetical protein
LQRHEVLAEGQVSARSPLVAAGRCEAGKVHLDNPGLYYAALKRFEGRVLVTVEPEPNTRSGKQHRFYHAFMGKWAASSELGYSHAELHELMKYRHNWKMMLVDGEEIRVGQTTTKLSVSAMTDYIEQVMQDAATWDSFLMQPNAAEDWR